MQNRLFLLFAAGICHAAALSADTDLNLVPYPKNVEIGKDTFNLNRPLIVTISDGAASVSRFLTDEFKAAGLPVPKAVKKDDGVIWKLTLNAAGEPIENPACLCSSESKEQYVLTVAKDGIVAAAGGESGLYYAVQTLRQLIHANRKSNSQENQVTIPCLLITDEPSLRWRCWMDDITRGPSPKIEPWLQQIALGSEFKHNLFTYYMQNQFEYKKYPNAHPKGGALTQDDLQIAVKFAKEHNLDILGCQQSFGHSQDFLATPELKHLGESGYILSPTEPKVYDFLDDLYSEMFPLVPFELFNVCCDETLDLAKKKPESIELAKKIGAGGVYMQHILKIYDLVKKRGKRLMMWGDIIVKYPDEIKKLPKDVIMLCWWYNEPCTVEKYESWIKPFSESGYEFWVCPGQSNWNRVLPAVDTYVPNLQKFVKIGTAHGTSGMLNTGWEDDGESLHSYNVHAIAWGAECAWNGGKTDYKDFNRRLGAVLFGTDGGDFGKAVDMIAVLQSKYGLNGNNVFWQHDFFVLKDDMKTPLEIAALSKQALTLLDNVKKKAKTNQAFLDGYILGVKKFEFIGQRQLNGAAVKKSANAEDAKQHIDKTRQALADIRDEFVRIWNTESQTYALDKILNRYAAYDRYLASTPNALFTKVLKLDKTSTSDADLKQIAADYPNLVELTLSETKITDDGLVPLTKLTKLRKIRISNTAITDAAAKTLSAMPGLQDIDVSQTSFGDAGLARLKTLPKLKRLNFYTTKVTDAGLDAFKEFQSAETLTWLNIDKCSMTDAAIPKLQVLKNLDWLHLGRTALTDAGLAELEKLTTLKEVSITHTHVSSAGADALKKALPECKVNF